MITHRYTHSDTRPYVCELCSRGFNRLNLLKEHMRIHTGEKPYKCDTCGQAFRHRAHYSTHLKKHRANKDQNQQDSKPLSRTSLMSLIPGAPPHQLAKST